MLLTLPGSLLIVVPGLAVMTAGFFIVHGVASGGYRCAPTPGAIASGQAASLYLFAYYLGPRSSAAWPACAWTRVPGRVSSP